MYYDIEGEQAYEQYWDREGYQIGEGFNQINDDDINDAGGVWDTYEDADDMEEQIRLAFL